MDQDRLTEIEVALAYDRKMIDDLSDALYASNKEIELLRRKVEKLERLVEQLLGQAEGPPPNEVPPHY
jgi:uncharacterized coiled-coil protein SlyX